jgi:uncharacterized membrane protein
MLQHILDLFGKPEFSVIEAHQASTHLSIGLLLGAVFFDFAALLFKSRRLVWQESAFWMQMLGTVALLATFGLGYFGNPFAGKTNDLAQKATWHQNFAYATLGTFVLLALWRLARHRNWKRIEFASYTIATLIGVGLVAFTGWMGGHIME